MQDLLRRPEYTGENRCLPCTLLNVIVAIFISVVLLFVSPLGDILSYLIFVIVFLLSISMIYLRGYLVPKTPTLTKRFLPPWVLHLLGKDQKHQSVHSPISSTLRTQTKEGTQEQFLQDIGALRPCVEKQDLCLTESFRKEWNTEIESIQDQDVTADVIPRQFDFPEDDYTIEEFNDSWIIKHDGYTLGKWPSKAALIADSAAGVVLESWMKEWDKLTHLEKCRLIGGLR